ncbi:MAG: hypothetical protein GY715_00765 [Planctomycetes bacterium]|nr:hypothetical protein [Planctomycetota bacterium]
MQRGRIVRWLAPVFGLTLVATLTPVAPAHDGADDGGFRGVYTTYPNHRLSRHRSGYLYRPLRYQRYGSAVRYDPGYGYGCGGNGYANSGPPPVDDRADFDFRRDRLLDAASRIDVRYIDSATTTYERYNNTRPRSKPATGKGWALLGDGEGVRALGRFTARLLTAPTDGEALVGFALAASMIGDDEAAIRSMRSALRSDPATVVALSVNEELGSHVRKAITRYEALAEADSGGSAQLMTAALHYLLGENDAARASLGKLDGRRVDEREARVLSTIVGPAPAKEAPTPVTSATAPASPPDAPPITELPAVAVR